MICSDPHSLRAGAHCLGVAVFAAGPHQVTVKQILEAAAWRGEWATFRARWEVRQRAVQAAAAAGRSAAPEAVEAWTDAFRYARGLLAAEECEQWLAQRGLTFDDLHAHAAAQVLAEQGKAWPCPADGRLDESSFWSDVLLADEFSRWARALAWRMALACENRLLPSGDPPWAELWPALEEAFAAARAAHLTTTRRQGELAGLRLSLFRCAIETADFGSEAAAREAVLCAREEGLSLAELASAHGFFVQHLEAFLGDLPDDWQAPLLSAHPGEVTLPPAGPGGGLVLRLLAKREPALDCPQVEARVDASLERRFFGELEARHIRWLLNIEVEA